MSQNAFEEAKILIVDDVPENLEIAGNILENSGYDVYTADSGKTALELLGNVQMDLILLDIMMPQLDGFETCKIIKNDINTRNIPILFLTAKVDVESVTMGFEYGAVDYIRKPFNAFEMLARVKIHIQLRRASSALEEKNKALERAFRELSGITSIH